MDKKPLFIAGPCVIESAELLDTVAATLADINRRLGVEIIFKASFDKANRTSISSFRGPGLEKGLYKRVLFCGTGALLSPVITSQGESIPGICHLVCLEAL